MLMELIKQKDEEIKKLHEEIKRIHEVYDVENVMKMVETLNDENDTMYNKLMMIKLSYKLVAKKHNKLVERYNHLKRFSGQTNQMIKEFLALDDD